MGYHIIKNDGTYVHWVRELSNSGNYDASTHFYIETENTDDDDVTVFSTYDSATQQIVINQALKDEVKEIEVRRIRNDLLTETDWMAAGDRTISQAEKDYRQALRDVTSQEGFPHNVTWPTKP